MPLFGVVLETAQQASKQQTPAGEHTSRQARFSLQKSKVSLNDRRCSRAPHSSQPLKNHNGYCSCLQIEETIDLLL
jgi:hypothetical protein